MWFDTLQTAFPGLFVLSVSGLNSGVYLLAVVGLALFIFMGFVSLNTDLIHTDLFRCARKSLGFASASPEACLCWPRQGISGTQKPPPCSGWYMHVPPARRAQKHRLCLKTLQCSNPSKLHSMGFLCKHRLNKHCQRLARRKTDWRKMGCLVSALQGLGSSFFFPPQFHFCVSTPHIPCFRFTSLKVLFSSFPTLHILGLLAPSLSNPMAPLQNQDREQGETELCFFRI